MEEVIHFMWEMVSLDMYQTFIENSLDAIVLIPLNGDAIEMNQAVFHMFGYTKEELKSKKYSDMLLPTHMEMVMKQIELALQGTSNTFKAEAQHKNGKLFHIQVTLNPLIEDGQVKGVFCVARNITELVTMRETLTETTDRLSALFESTADAIEILDLEGHVIDVNPAFEGLYGWSIDEIKGEFLPTIPQNRFLEAKSLIEQIKAGNPVVQYEIVCVKKNEELLEISLTLSPIHNKNGDLVGFSGITRDISKRKNLERLLKISEERYRKLVELSPTGIVVHRNNEILYANDAVQKLFAVDNAVGSSIFDYIHPRFQEFTELRLSRIAEGSPIEFVNLKLVGKDGEHLYANIGTMKIPYDNETAYLAMFHDVTEYKKMKRDLQESRNSYSELLKMSPLPIYVQCEGIIKYMNEAGAKALGYNHPKELIGKSILDFYHPDSRQKVEERMKRAFLHGFDEDDRFEHQMIRANGTEFATEVSATVTKFFGSPAIQVIFRDITDRKQAEEALRASEENYRLMADNMTDLVSIVDESGLMRYASPSHLAVLGHSPDFYLGKSAFEVVHPEDLPYMMSEFEQILRSNESRVAEFRHKHADGSWIWVEAKGKIFMDQKTLERRIIIVSRDVMERKTLQEKLNHMAYHDALTDLPNRMYFQDKVEETIKHSLKNNEMFALLYMDLDKFKDINDQYGHAIGDQVLIQFAEKVQTCLRKTDTIARQGGDEFTLLIPNINEENDAVVCAERILELFDEPWEVRGHLIQTSTSIGIAYYPQTGNDYIEILKHADMAMYDSKQQGKNRMSIS